MKNFERQLLELPCPGCGRNIEVSYYELYTRRKPTCKRCRSYYEVAISDASKLRSEVRDIQRNYNRINKILLDIAEDSDRMIK